MKKKPFNTEGTDISKTYELKQQVGPALKKECLHNQKCITQNTGTQDKKKIKKHSIGNIFWAALR